MANPFADSQHIEQDDDPFSDPSIKGALGSNKDFEESNISLGTPVQSSVQVGRTDDTAARLEEIRKREEELERRERNLGQREEHIRKHGRNNWPPFYPLIYHDIDAEIPAESQTTVRTLYRIWLFLILALLINLAGCILLLVSGQPDGGADLGSSITYIPVIGGLSFLLWYRPFYNGYMKEHALFYYLYFVFGGFHIAYCVYMFIGIPSTGSAGLINMIHAFATGSIVTGVIGVLATVAWGLEGLGCLWIYRSVWAHHNEKGHTFARAKTELGQHGFRAYFTTGNKV